MRNALGKILVPFGAAVLLLAPRANAQEAGKGMHESGRFILSAERLMGLNFWSVRTQQDPSPTDPTPTDTTTSGTNGSLLFGPNFTGDLGSVSPYMTPRLAFDFLPIESLTIGGSIGFASTGSETERLGQPTDDNGTITAFALTPRVGYILPLADWVYFWPRLGVTYFNVSATNAPTPPTPQVTTSINGFAINIEPGFVFSPVPHFGISVMPVADIPLAGSSTQDPDPTPEPETRIRIRNIGAVVGILGYF
jgi:hypothetical protein